MFYIFGIVNVVSIPIGTFSVVFSFIHKEVED